MIFSSFFIILLKKEENKKHENMDYYPVQCTNSDIKFKQSLRSQLNEDLYGKMSDLNDKCTNIRVVAIEHKQCC